MDTNTTVAILGVLGTAITILGGGLVALWRRGGGDHAEKIMERQEQILSQLSIQQGQTQNLINTMGAMLAQFQNTATEVRDDHRRAAEALTKILERGRH